MRRWRRRRRGKWPLWVTLAGAVLGLSYTLLLALRNRESLDRFISRRLRKERDQQEGVAHPPQDREPGPEFKPPAE